MSDLNNKKINPTNSSRVIKADFDDKLNKKCTSVYFKESRGEMNFGYRDLIQIFIMLENYSLNSDRAKAREPLTRQD